MRELNYQLKQLCRRNRDGSYRTQADRERQLTLIANQLQALEYRKMNAQSLKPKHVEALVKHFCCNWRIPQVAAQALTCSAVVWLLPPWTSVSIPYPSIFFEMYLAM